MAPPYRASYRGSARHGRAEAAGFPWLVKAMMAVIVMAAFVVLVLVWSQSGAPSQIPSATAANAAPTPQDGVTTLSE